MKPTAPCNWQYRALNCPSWPPVRAIRGRLQYLCPQRKGWPPGHDEFDPLHRRAAQVTDQRAEECRRPAVAAIVPWLYGHGRTAAAAAYRRQGRGPVQGPGSRPDPATSRRGPGSDDRRPEPAVAGMGRIFRLQPVARVGIIGWLDTQTLALRRLGPVEDARQTLQGAASPEGLREGGQCGHLQPKGTVAAEFGGRPAPGLHQQTLQRSWIVFHRDADGRLIRRTAVVRTR